MSHDASRRARKRVQVHVRRSIRVGFQAAVDPSRFGRAKVCANGRLGRNRIAGLNARRMSSGSRTAAVQVCGFSAWPRMAVAIGAWRLSNSSPANRVSSELPAASAIIMWDCRYEQPCILFDIS